MPKNYLFPLILLATPVYATPANDAALLDRMTLADVNHDGIITKKEFLDFRASNFDHLDRNHDGVLTRSDIPGFLQGRGGPLDFDALLNQCDVNHDGKVSRDEFVNGPTPLFDAADTNHDGAISEAERQAAMARAKAARGN